MFFCSVVVEQETRGKAAKLVAEEEEVAAVDC
jgi:hypothetical protein